MRNQYRFILSVECPGGKRHSTAFDVGAHAAPQFEPYDLCSSPMGAGLAGGVMPQRAARIDVEREALAQQIANGAEPDVFLSASFVLRGAVAAIASPWRRT